VLWVARRQVWAGGGRATGGSTPPPVPTLAVHDPSWTPLQPDIANGNAITLGGRFTASGSIDLGGVAFYAPATVGGTYTAGIWQTTTDDDGVTPGTGTLVGQVSVMAAAVTAGAWNYLAVPVTVTAGLVWTAGVWTSTGRFVRTADTYNAGTLSGHGITFLQNGTDPNPPGLGSMFNGVFADDPGGAGLAYPVSVFGQADYGIDVWL
jgi:hypothetical protein